MQIYYRSVSWNDVAACENTAVLRTKLSNETGSPLSVEQISVLDEVGGSFGYYSEVGEFAESIRLLDDEDEQFPQQEQFSRFMHTFFTDSVNSEIEISNDAGIYAVIAPARLKEMASLFSKLDMKNLKVGHAAVCGDDGELSADEIALYVAAMGEAVTDCAARERAVIIFLE